MIRGIYTNAGAMLSNQLKQEITANNIANVNTTGYKKDGVFRKYLVDHATVLRQNATDFKNLEDVDDVFTDFSQGALIPTENPLDTAIDGSGFFAVQTPSGVLYTRNGNLSIDQNGFLMTGNGYLLQGNIGPIQVLGDEIAFNEDGGVFVDGALVDVIQIVDFPQPYQLNKIGDGLYEAAPGTAQIASTDQFKLRQGFIEQSNVEIIREMVEIIRVARDFESNQKSITMQDATVDRAVNDVGVVRR
ncbi:flagellar basal-body rod protein FlgF [candidate division KSB1 bacterium]